MNLSYSGAGGKRDLDRIVPAEGERLYIDSRVKDIELASGRSRWLFGFSVALSWLLLAMAYNSQWSWMRRFAEVHELAPLLRDSRTVRDVLVENLMAGWVDSLYFEVPFIGARFSSSDAGTIGGLLLALLCTWCFYSLRRENHLIFYVVRDAERYSFSEVGRKYLKNQLHATPLFSPSGTTEALGPAEFVGQAPTRRSRLIGLLAWLMFAFAPLSLAALLVTDVASLFTNSPFREGGALFAVFWEPCGRGASCRDFVVLCLRLACSAVFLGLAAYLMCKAYDFQRQTRRLLAHVTARTG